MCFETRKRPEEIKGAERLTSEDIRELFERYGGREPAELELTKAAKAPDEQRELLLSKR